MPNSNTIRFLDIHAQQAKIKTELKQGIDAVLEHGQFILGPEVSELEQRFCQMTGSKHTITCANGTDALKLLMMAKKVGPNDAIFVPTFTFAATAEVVAESRAVPIFIDIQRDTFNIDPKSLEQGIQAALQLGLNPKGIIAVDLFGLPAHYRALKEIADQHQLWIIDDAAQSFGSKIGDQYVGTFCEMTTTSFFPSKPLGCYGDGGAIFTGDDALTEQLRSLRVHGEGVHKYDNVRVGLNSRLDTIQAAILLAKLNIFEEEIEQRQAIAAYYQNNLPSMLQTPRVPEGLRSAWALYTITCDADLRDLLVAQLDKKGIPTRVYYQKPLHQQAAYQDYPRAAPQLPTAEHLANQVLSLPMHPYLTEGQLALIVSAIHQVTDTF
ncbi:MAG: DegT/DnrJ/EryC1/StrS aminotransferase family protein [Gammaproteobacteria bacterium]